MLDVRDPDTDQRLSAFSMRTVAQWWWEVTRLLVPALAERGDRHMAQVRDLIFGELSPDFRSVRPLLVALQTDNDDKGRADPTIEQLLTTLLAYRNREVGHGADWHRLIGITTSAGFYC